jgi:hypothetical protein
VELVSDLKKRGVTGVAVASSFCRWMIQPIKDRVHPAYESYGQSNPTSEVNRKVSKEEMAARVSQMYYGGEGEKVSEGTLVEEAGCLGWILKSICRSLHFAFLICLGRITSISLLCRCASFRCGAQHLSLRGSCTRGNLGRISTNI